MFRFWQRYTGPLIEAVQPKRIVEIGAEFGWNTRPLLAYCKRVGGFIDIIDTKPHPSLLEALEPYGPETYALHAGKSIDVVPGLAAPDVVMLDGDHNWRTVFTELSLLLARAQAEGKPMPAVFAHDCAWPYARRDMYYNPADFTEQERHPFAYKGMLPGVTELVQDGINGWFANALVEGGPENGVLTGIEDFVAANPGLKLWALPFFNGLGIIIPEARMTPQIAALIDSFHSGESLMETCKTLEAQAMRVRAEVDVERRRLARRTDALERARGLLDKRAARIAELEAALARAEAEALA